MLTSIWHKVSPRYAAGIGFSQSWIGTPSSVSYIRGRGRMRMQPLRCRLANLPSAPKVVVCSFLSSVPEYGIRRHSRRGDHLNYGWSRYRDLSSEVEVAHRTYDEGDDQQDCDDQGNPSQASHPALTSAPIRRRVGLRWRGIAVRLLKADTSRSSATTAAANAPRARASRGMVVVPVRSLCHVLPLPDYSQGDASPDYHTILLLPSLLSP